MCMYIQANKYNNNLESWLRSNSIYFLPFNVFKYLVFVCIHQK